MALDLETTIKTKPWDNDYVHAMWKRHPQRIIQCWGALEPAKEDVLDEARKAVKQFGLSASTSTPSCSTSRWTIDAIPLFEEISSLGAAVMIDVGTTGMGAGMPGGTARSSAMRILRASTASRPIFRT